MEGNQAAGDQAAGNQAAGDQAEGNEALGRGEPDEDVMAFATRLFGLAREGATATLAAYIEAGVNADLTNQSGDSLLMLAAYHGRADTVRALLAGGADPNRANDRGQTPLAGAVFKSEVDVVRALVEGGADPAAGRPSALETAALFGRQDLTDLMDPPA